MQRTTTLGSGLSFHSLSTHLCTTRAQELQAEGVVQVAHWRFWGVEGWSVIQVEVQALGKPEWQVRIGEEMSPKSNCDAVIGVALDLLICGGSREVSGQDNEPRVSKGVE